MTGCSTLHVILSFRCRHHLPLRKHDTCHRTEYSTSQGRTQDSLSQDSIEHINIHNKSKNNIESNTNHDEMFSNAQARQQNVTFPPRMLP